MNIFSKVLPLAAACLGSVFAGGINVVHLGPPDVLKFEVSSGGASQGFDLAYRESTGPFVLPEKPATISVSSDELPTLEISATAKPQIAVLYHAKDGYTWRMFSSKPTDEEWSLRIVNLSSDPAPLLVKEEGKELAAGAELEIPVKSKKEVRVEIKDSLGKPYNGEEPCAVVVFLFRSNGEWKSLFVADR